MLSTLKIAGFLTILLFYDIDPGPFPMSAGQLRLKGLTEIDDMLREIHNSVTTKKRDRGSRLIITELRKLIAVLKDEV